MDMKLRFRTSTFLSYDLLVQTKTSEHVLATVCHGYLSASGYSSHQDVDYRASARLFEDGAGHWVMVNTDELGPGDRAQHSWRCFFSDDQGQSWQSSAQPAPEEAALLCRAEPGKD